MFARRFSILIIFGQCNRQFLQIRNCRGRAHKPEGFGSYQTRNDDRDICRPYKSAFGGIIVTESYIWRDERTAWRIIEGEAVIVTPLDSKVHILNEVGTRIWELLEGKEMKVGQIIEMICEEFEVAQKKAEEDVNKFVKEMCEKGIVKIRAPGQKKSIVHSP